MRSPHAHEGAGELCRDVKGCILPRQHTPEREGKRDCRIEVSPRDRPENQDQHRQHGAGRNRVAQERQRIVPACELGRHDARPDHGGQEKRRAQPLGEDALRARGHQVVSAAGAVV